MEEKWICIDVSLPCKFCKYFNYACIEDNKQIICCDKFYRTICCDLGQPFCCGTYKPTRRYKKWIKKNI